MKGKEEFLLMAKISGTDVNEVMCSLSSLMLSVFRDVTQKSLRQAIGVVPQDSVLFNSSIGYNIGYAANHFLK